MMCNHNDEPQALFIWERKIELLVHTLMQQAIPNVDSKGKLHPRLRNLVHMLESFSQVSLHYDDPKHSRRETSYPSNSTVRLHSCFPSEAATCPTHTDADQTLW